MTVPYQHLKYRDNVCIEDWNPFELIVACVGPVREILRQKSLSSSFNPYGPYWVCPSTQHVALELPSSCVLPGCTARTWKMYTWLRGLFNKWLVATSCNYDTLERKNKNKLPVTTSRIHNDTQECTRLYKHSHVHFSCPESSRPAQGASQGWHTATNWATHPWSRPLRCSSQQTWYQLVPLLQPRPCKTPIQSKVCDILLQQRVLWEQMKATIISYRKMFIPVQSYLHSSYKALSRQLSSVTAWSRGMAEGKRIHRHVSERRVLPLNDLSFARNESGPSTGARCHAPTQCQSKSSQQQQKQNLPNARFN